MSYIFKALVIDDESQIKSRCTSYKKYLMEQGIDINFDVINNENEYIEGKPYDILLVDYDLKKTFYVNGRGTGDEFIKSFRKINRISKVIFYSSEFTYQPVQRKYTFPFKGKEAFDLINDLQVDRIADKNNFDMMVSVIKDCCEQIDLIPLILSKTMMQYKKEDINVSYTNSKGEEIEITELLQELMNDTEEGRAFRRKITDTVLSVLLNYNY